MSTPGDRWMVCSACRKDIPFSATYYACSVSTCNRAAIRLVFCSVPCWDSHLADMRHRDAGAIEQRAPARAEAAAPRPMAQARPVPEAGAPAGPMELSPADESDVLIVISRVKKYIRDRSGMNTSDAVAERLSVHVRILCDAAIRAAAQDGRKTVLERDVPRAGR